MAEIVTERFDAATFLARLTAPVTGISVARAATIGRPHSGSQEPTVDDLPGDWRIEFEERAAIREFEGGQLREHAERDALGEILARMRTAGENPV